MTRKALHLGAMIALLFCGTARAADSYRITAGGNQDWGPKTGGLDATSPTQLDERGTMTDNGNVVGSVKWHMQAGPGIARASMVDGNVTVPSNLAYPFNPSLQAVANTELTVNGPGFELNTSVNLHVDGYIDKPTCGGGADCGALSVLVSAPTGETARQTSEFASNGFVRANELGLAFDPVGDRYHVHGDVRSPQFGVRVGTPFPVGIVLNLSGRFAGRAETSFFGGTFDDPGQRLQVSFATSGPVLNDIPAANTVSGAGVVDNRWDDPFAGNLVVAACNDPALATATAIRGSLILRRLPGCPQLTFPQLTQIGGDLVIEDNAGGEDLDLSDVSVGGAIDVSGNSGDLTIDTGSVGGAIDVSGTGGDLTIDTGSVGGAIDVSGTGGDLSVDTGSVGGAIDVSGNSGDLTIDTGSTGGDLDISDNTGDAIDVGDGQIGGDLTITDNGTAVVNANDSLTVSGDVDVSTDGGGMLDLSGVEAEGDETVSSGGAVSANTAGGATDVSILGGVAALHAVLPDGTFDQPVAFTITPRGDDPAEGAVDPLAGYAFAFAVPALNADARLAFTIDLAALDAATRAALLAGIASGSATIATKPDAAGSAYTAFARCTRTQTPEADGCVAVTPLAADGSVAAGEPALVRFDGIAGHFSTYAVALVSARPPTPPATSPPPAVVHPAAAQLRTQITPHGKAARIGALLRRGYRLRFHAPAAGVARVAWYRGRTLIASGRHRFIAAGVATITVKLTTAGRRQLRRARRLAATARGTFTPASGAPASATRAFTLRR